MARKRSLQSTCQTRQFDRSRKAGIKQQPPQKMPAQSCITNQRFSGNNSNDTGAGVDEIEIISEDDLPLEDQPEDGELSEIRSVLI